MAIDVVPYTADLEPRVRDFNQRMKDGGTHWGWYESSVPDWVPKHDGAKTWRELWLALEDGQHVRGGYALKPHEWWVKGESRTVTDWQGPVSEGLISRQYNTLGLRLIRDMLKKYPLLYSWGHGGHDEPMLQLIRTLKWSLHDTPFLVRILHPSRFLRKNRYLRKDPKRNLAMDVAAWTGLGSIGFRALHTALALRTPRMELLPVVGGRATAEVVPRFGEWADTLWDRVKNDYSAIAFRDAATMNALVPEHGWFNGIRLRVRKGEETVGWAVVLDTQMKDDARFGDLRVGSVVDALASPRDARHVIGAAFRFLRERNVDLVVANQSHPKWIDAFRETGFWTVPNKRVFAVSPELQKTLEPWDLTRQGLFLTNMDGHGPHAL